MRRLRYLVATSLDGYIAGPNGEFDWIIMDPEIDFDALYRQFDTILMGRRTFEVAGGGSMPGTKVYVFSRTLKPEDHPKTQIVSENSESFVASLKTKPGKDIWLFGGGLLFRSLLAAGLVDSVEVGVMPILLGGGISLFPPPASAANLELKSHRLYSSTGIVSLEYAVKPA
jgi:dihydrofolate reductase